MPIEINTYLPTADVNVVKKVKNFHQLVETTDINLRQKDEQIDAGEAMWLMEATGNYLYNRNAKYKHDIENLGLDFELCFKLEQSETKQPTVSKNEVTAQLQTLQKTIESRSKSLNRLPRLIDYEIASIKGEMVNFKVKVVLVTEELRESYDANRIYGLPEVRRESSSNVNISNIDNYDCALLLGSIPAPDYVDAVLECLENNYGQFFATSIETVSSHDHTVAYEGDNPNPVYQIECYDDGYYDEYAMKGEVWSHGNYPHEEAGEKAIDLWNGDIATFSPSGYINQPNIGNPQGLAFGPQNFVFEYIDISSYPYWCIRGVTMGRNYLYSDF